MWKDFRSARRTGKRIVNGKKIVDCFTVISNVKYRFMFLMTITRKGRVIPRTVLGFFGAYMKVVETFVPAISSTNDLTSSSVTLLM